MPAATSTGGVVTGQGLPVTSNTVTPTDIQPTFSFTTPTAEESTRMSP
jgi:hypothetical protein